jgi:hypothetical protein
MPSIYSFKAGNLSSENGSSFMPTDIFVSLILNAASLIAPFIIFEK